MRFGWWYQRIRNGRKRRSESSIGIEGETIRNKGREDADFRLKSEDRAIS